MNLSSFGLRTSRKQSGRSKRSLAVEILEDRSLLNAQMTPLLPLPPLPTPTPSLQINPNAYDASSVLVRFQPGTVQSGQILAPGIEVGNALPLVDGLYRVNLQAGIGVQDAVTSLQARAGVLYAQPNYLVHTYVTPNDPLFGQQYALNNTGQTAGQADADIDGPEAWDIYTGSSSVVVAVIDTGMDYNHPDLAANIWTNSGEVAGNGIDDDNNGYVDDIHGYDFANNDSNPIDDHGHGTHVSGTIGAVADNGIGVAGIAWNVKIMAVKFLDAQGSGSLDAAISALNYAVSNGATISNNSWGGGGYYAALNDAIAAAGTQGHIFVAAAGNDGNNNDANPGYPASYDLDNIISVAATDDTDQLAYFSNFGASSVDLGAPGVDILSTVPTSGDLGDPSGYRTLSGTSMATPHVTGVVALVRGQHPEWDYRRVIDQILGTVDPLSSLTNATATGGRLNAATAVGSALVVKGPRVLDADPHDVTPAPVSTAHFTFNKSVDPATFTADDVVSFSGPSGPLTVTGVQPVAGSNNRQFEVSFASQSAFGNYEMVLGPDIRDLDGIWMNQDNDNLNGEAAEDQFRLTFTLSDHLYVESTNVPMNIPGIWSGASLLYISSDFAIGDLNLTLDITHPNTGDLIIYLGHPSGSWLKMVDSLGTGANFAGTTFDDQATQHILQGSSPFAGSYRPVDPLSTFYGFGLRTEGTWGLIIANHGSTPGTLNSWSLTITPGGAMNPGDPGGGDPPPPGYEPPPPGGEPPPPGYEPPPPGGEPPPPGGEPPPPGYEPPPPGGEPPPPGYEPPPPGGEPPPPGYEPPPPGNRAPLANNDSASTNEDTPVAINVLANDSDPDGNAVSLVSINWAVGGAAVINFDQTVTFTPTPNYFGSASFGYTITDGLLSASAMASITVAPVNDVPVAGDDSAATDEDVPVIVAVLANDNDVDGDALTVASIDWTVGGHAVVNPDRTVTFTPTANYSGAASFGYTVSDGFLSTTAAATITVRPVNDAPVASDDQAETDEDLPVVVAVLANDSDAEGDALTVTSIDWTVGGTAVRNLDQTVSFTPNPNYYGDAYFGYTISDGLLARSATVSITVNPVNDAPVAVNDAASGTRDKPLTLLSSQLTANDSDIDGDSLQVVGVGNASHGSVAFQGSAIVFTPEVGYAGWAGFDYVVSDGQASASAHVNIDVRAISYFSTSAAGTLMGTDGVSISFANADVLSLTVRADGIFGYGMAFDGSDVGLSNSGENLDAFFWLSDGSLVISPSGSFSVPGAGGTTLTGAGEDLLRFAPTTLGDTTAGSWSFYFDGSDVGLSGTAENIDAAAVLPDGRILISTTGGFSVPGVATGGVGHDVIVFTPTSLGATTTGTWGMYVDGSDVGLTLASENVDGLFVKPSATGGLPTLYLSTTGNFAVSGASGAREDAFAYKPTTTGWTSAGTFGPGLALDGSLYGLAGFNLDGIYLAAAPTTGGAGAAGSKSSAGATVTGGFAGLATAPAPSTLVPYYPALTPASVSAVLASAGSSSDPGSPPPLGFLGISGTVGNGIWDWLDEELIALKIRRRS